MPTPRKPRQSRTTPQPAPSAGNPLAKWRPDLSRPGLFRFAGRCLVAFAFVGCLTTVAGWHSAGLVQSGRIERMLRMGSGVRLPVVDARSRGKLDRGRLNALIATTGK